jgi:type IV pilus assembly protein PilV
MLRRRASGSSLLEVLVAITIASLGLLALAGSHLHALRQASLQQHRLVAAWLVSDLAERIRVNSPTAADAASYEFTDPFAAQATLAAAPVPACDAPADNCTVAQMAAADLHAWRSRLRAQLPRGAGFVRPDPLVAGAIDIWAAWTEPEAPASDEDLRIEGARECPVGLDTGSNDVPVRCHTLRIQL